MWNDFKYSDLLQIPPSKKPCFLAGTWVKTADGHTPIESVEPGTLVYAYNTGTGEAEIREVTATFENTAEMYVRITTAGDTVCATGMHRFWIPQEGRWRMANSLAVGMQFLNHGGDVISIKQLQIVEASVKTYNLEVADLHSYFVGKDEVLTHSQTINSKSIFYSTEILNMTFYRLVEAVDENSIKPLYVGQTVQEFWSRYGQHRRDPKKPWMRDSRKNIGFIEIWVNGRKGPYRMTPYEAHVVEMYEIYRAGGRQGKDPGGKLKNKQRPIGQKKFQTYRNLPPPRNFNPCRFYV